MGEIGELPPIAKMGLGTPGNRPDAQAFTSLTKMFGDARLAWMVADNAQDRIMEQMRQTPRSVSTIVPGATEGNGYVVVHSMNQVKERGFVVGYSQDSTTMPVHGPEDIITPTHTAKEMLRLESIDGSAYLPGDVSEMRLNRLMVIFDDKGKAVKSVVLRQAHGPTDGEIASVTTHTEALHALRAPLIRERSETELAHLFERADEVFGPETRFAKERSKTVGHGGRAYGNARGDFQTLERQLSLEHSFRFIELLDQFSSDSEAQSLLYSLVSLHYPFGELAIQLCDTKQDISRMIDMMTHSVDHAVPVLKNFFDGEMDVISPDNTKEPSLPYENPLQRTIYRLNRSLAKSAMLHGRDAGFSWDIYDQSCVALSQTLDEMVQLGSDTVRYDQGNPADQGGQHLHQQLSEFSVRHVNSPTMLGSMEPLLERYFLLKLERIIPGDMESDMLRFYQSIKADLNSHSEATGDDELQLGIQVRMYDLLAKTGRWKEGMCIVDQSCGNKKRILWPSLESDVMKQHPPGAIVGVDAVHYPDTRYPNEYFIQGNLSNPAYLEQMQQRLEAASPSEMVDLMTNMWSGFSDNDPIAQEMILILTSYALKKADPALQTKGGVYFLELPMKAYLKQMIPVADEEKLLELGKAILHYPTEGGMMDKKLEILLTHDLIQNHHDAGLQLLNVGDSPEIPLPWEYVTGSGVPRIALVSARVGDPVPSLALAKVLESYEKTPSEKRLITEAQYRFLLDIFSTKETAWVGSSSGK